MSENSTEDKPFENYLKGKDKLSSAYRAGSVDSPSANLDHMILEASRKAVKKKPRIAYSPFSSNWGIPVSIAAILVLSISIVPLMQESEDFSDLNNLPESYQSVPQKMDSKSKLKEEKRYREQPAKTKMPAPSAIIRHEPVAEDIGATMKDSVSRKPAEVMQAKPALKKKSRKITAPASAPAPMPAPVIETEESIKGPGRSYAAPIEQMQKQQENQRPRQRIDDKAHLDSASELHTPTGVTSDAMVILSPEEWIKKIKALHEAGKTKDAKKSLEEFKKLYPEYPVDINLDD